jgi:hypothetical protein
VAASCDTNIISFGRNKFQDTTSPTTAAQDLLRACRDRLLDGVCEEFLSGLENAADHLFDLADQSIRLETQTLYLAAHRTIGKNGPAVLRCFRNAFNHSFDTSLETLFENARQSSATESCELGLLADSEFEKNLAVDKLSSRASYTCSEQLTALERRVAAVLDGAQITQDSNPLFPRALYSAFLGAVTETSLDDQVGITLLQEFDRQVCDKLPKLYATLNQLLVDQGILPKIPLINGSAAQRDVAAQQPNSSENDPTTDNPTKGPKESAADIFCQLASVFQRSRVKSPTDPKIAYSSGSSRKRAKFLEVLTGIQRGESRSWSLSGIDQEQFGYENNDILRQIRSTPLISYADPSDAATVDIIATLFDYVLSNVELPHPLRRELGRLQVPVLKAALKERAFFSDDQHPARYLLDLIVSSSLGWSRKDAPRYYAKIESIVDEILNTYEEDIGVIASQPGKLEQLVAEEDNRAWENATHLAREIDRQEWEKDARSAASNEIRRHLDNPELPKIIRDFLSKLWQLTLVLVFARSGKESIAWRDAVQTMDELVWSVAPKVDSQQRKRFFVLLPDLLQRLHDGIKTLKIDRSSENRFFAQLARLHSKAVNPVSRHEEELEDRRDVDVDDPFADTSASLEDSVKASLNSSATLRFETMAVGYPDDYSSAASEGITTSNASRTDALPFSAKEGAQEEAYNLQQFRLGTWVEFVSDRGTKTTFRLSWISGSGNIYLFANRQGEDALTLSAERLLTRLRERSAKILSGERLTTRAIASMLKSRNSAGQEGGNASPNISSSQQSF